LLREVRQAVRRLIKTPVFTAVAILTLTLGIGANTALFTLLHSLILRDPAVKDPGSLVQLSLIMRNGQQNGLSFPAFRQIERHANDVFSSVVGWTQQAANADVNGDRSRATVLTVTGNFHGELGARPALGRLLTADDVVLDPPTASPVAVIGYGLWQRHFGRDPDVVGRTIRLDGEPFTVVGVTERSFQGLNRVVEPDITVPITSLADASYWHLGNVLWVNVIGRLKPGLTLPQARARLAADWPNVLADTMPSDFSGVRRENFLNIRLIVETVVTPVERFLRRQFTQPLLVVMGIAALVLTIACVNMATLMLVRTMRRRHEIGIHLSAGASRWRVMRHVLTEGVLLSTVGGACGLLAASYVSRALAKALLERSNLSLALGAGLDGRVLTVAGILALGSGIVFSALPAWHAAKRNVVELLQEGRTTARSRRLGRALVACQIALCLMLLIDAGLLIRTLEELRSFPSGYVTTGVSAAQLLPRSPSPNPPADVEGLSYGRTLVDSVTSRLGAQEAALTFVLPGAGQSSTEFVAASATPKAETAAQVNAVSPGFFQLMGMRLLQGRDFTWTDRQRAQPVAILSAALARHLFGDQPAIGQYVRIGFFPHRQQLQVVGIVSDARLYRVRESSLYAAYTAHAQDSHHLPGYGSTLLVRGGDVSPQALTRVLESLGRDSLFRVVSLDDIREGALLAERVAAIIAGFFSTLALLIAGIGVYGLMSHDVLERSKELRIRMALGATPHRLIASVLTAGAVTSAVGVILGLAGSWASVRLVRSLLFGVNGYDPVALGGAAVLLMAVAVAACIWPAMQATRLEGIR
jgi:predicted permease